MNKMNMQDAILKTVQSFNYAGHRRHGDKNCMVEISCKGTLFSPSVLSVLSLLI